MVLKNGKQMLKPIMKEKLMPTPDEYGIRNYDQTNGEARDTGLRAVEESFTAREITPTEERDVRAAVIDRLARDIRWLPLRTAMLMAEEVTKLPEYKPEWPNKIELAMLFNQWAHSKGDD